MRAGVLVCGGSSTRFGDADKVTYPLEDKPLVRHVADRLVPVIDELVVNCRASQREALVDAFDGYPHDRTVAVDETEDAGPLYGIGRGLSAAAADWAVVVACDMPFVDSSFVEYLFDRAAAVEGAIPRYGAGDWYQPLQAVYAVDAMVAAVEAAETEGLDRPIHAVQKLDVVTVEGEELWNHAEEGTFFNVNTREDLEAARDRLRSGSV